MLNFRSGRSEVDTGWIFTGSSRFIRIDLGAEAVLVRDVGNL